MQTPRVSHHRGGPGATGRREAPADKLQLVAAGMDPPAVGGGRAESPERLHCEPCC